VPRLFVAVALPKEVLDALAALGRPDEPGVRYTRREQWHVTLRFLGRAEIDDAAGALARLDAAPADAVLGPAVSRLGRDVVCVPVDGLDELAAAVVAATAEVGGPPEPRRFAGHVTLARLRRRGACRIAGAPFHARFPVTEVALVESVPGSGGPTYMTRTVQPLRA
jgi:2'-5' RNA ligase